MKIYLIKRVAKDLAKHVKMPVEKHLDEYLKRSTHSYFKGLHEQLEGTIEDYFHGLVKKYYENKPTSVLVRDLAKYLTETIGDDFDQYLKEEMMYYFIDHFEPFFAETVEKHLQKILDEPDNELTELLHKP